MKKFALILSAALCAGAFAQTYPGAITEKANWAEINAEGAYTDFNVDGGSIEITANAFNSGKNILLTDKGGSILVGDAYFDADNFTIAGAGSLSFDGFGDMGISSFSMNANSSVNVKSISVKNTSVDFYKGSTISFGGQGADGPTALAISDAGDVSIHGNIEIDISAYRESMDGTPYGYWDLASVDSTSSFTFDAAQSVVASDLGEFQLQSTSGNIHTYVLNINGEVWSLIATSGQGGNSGLILAATVPEASHFAAIFGVAILALAIKRRRK